MQGWGFVNAAVLWVLAPTQASSRNGKPVLCSVTRRELTLASTLQKTALLLLLRNSNRSLMVAWRKMLLKKCLRWQKLPTSPKVTLCYCMGDFDKHVQTYIIALQKDGGPISAPVVLAAAEGIITAHSRYVIAIKFKQHRHNSILILWTNPILVRLTVTVLSTTQTKAKLSDDKFPNWSTPTVHISKGWLRLNTYHLIKWD